MHILLKTLFNTINSADGDSDENCATLKIVLKGLQDLEEQNLALVNKVLTKLHINVLFKNLKKDLPTLDSPQQAGETALIMAAKNGLLRFVHLLLEYKANPDLRANNGYTALMWSIYNNHRGCALTLLAAKANPNILDNSGRTAIWHALFTEDEAYIQALIRRGAKLEIPNNDGLTLLGEAIKRERLGPLSLALAYGCLIRPHHVALLEAFFSKKFLDLLYGLPTQKPSASFHLLEFCRGVLFEYKNQEEEAETCYRAAPDFAPADRKRGDLLKKKSHFLMAGVHYHKASQAGDFFAPGRLAGLLRRHETLTPDKIANPGYYLLSVTFLRKTASLIPPSAPLSSRKWRLLAQHTLANEDFNPLTRIQKTLSFIQEAKTAARTAADKRQNQKLLLSATSIFKMMRNRVSEPANLILEYSEHPSLTAKDVIVERLLEYKS